MKKRLHSVFCILQSSSALVAVVTLMATAAQAPGQPPWGHALLFGAFNYVEVAPTDALAPYPLTITAWVNTTDRTSSGAGVVARGDAAFGLGFALSLSEGHIRAWYYRELANYVGTSDGLGLDGGDVADGAWHHVAFTVGPSGGMLYVDGTAKAQAPWLGTPGAPVFPPEYPLPLWVGRRYYQGFNGSIDEVRLWNVARSQPEIQVDMNQPLTNAPPSLVAYYRFDEGAGYRAYDTTTNHFDGWLVNGAGWAWQAATLPYPVTLSASAKTATAVSLKGAIDPNALQTTAWFEWGTTTGYGISTAATNMGRGTNLVALSATLEGLTMGTTYHYRAVGSNSFGVAYGPDRSFTFLCVSNLADSGPGSLRQTIADAAGGDIIVVTNTGTLTLTTELAINKDLSIVGPGAASLSINGGGVCRAFTNAYNARLNISSLTIRNCRAPSGDNGSTPGDWGWFGRDGGAIYNSGQLGLSECVLTSNRAGDGGDGIAGANGTSGVSATNGEIGGNGGAGGAGGGIYNGASGELVLERCTISGNFSGAGGGAGSGGTGGSSIYDPGQGGNAGDGGRGGHGGGLHNEGWATLEGCTLSDNVTGDGGPGGVGGTGGANQPAPLYAYWGGNGGRGGAGGAGGTGSAVGGNGHTVLKNCTVSGNQTGSGGEGGDGGSGGFSAPNWPLTVPQPGPKGGGGNGGAGGGGGGIYSGGTLELGSCTMAYNATGFGGAHGDPGSYGTAGGGPGSDGAPGVGGGIRGAGQPPSIANTILAANTSPTRATNDVYGDFASQGHNLVGTASDSTDFDERGDLLNLDPQLVPLANNGGPTLTHAPVSTSPVINAGRNQGAPDTDQRGLPRIMGGTIDIGAYEYQSPQSLISYAWLQQYGWPKDGSVDYLDPDGDHMNNWQEWRCGTDPTSASSVLRMLPLLRNGSEVVLSWESVPQQTYLLERSMGLGETPAFQTLATNLPGQLGTTSYTDTNAVINPALYRVGVEP